MCACGCFLIVAIFGGVVYCVMHGMWWAAALILAAAAIIGSYSKKARAVTKRKLN